MKVWLWLCGIITCIVVALFFVQTGFAASSEMEILLKKLQEKGVLSATEAESIAKETKAAAAEKEKKEKKKEADAKGWQPPEWLKNTKVKGDLRLRYEGQDREDDGRGTRRRGRFRLRVGAETKIAEGIDMGFGLASAMPGTSSDRPGGDPRSGNWTLQDSFSRKDIWIDYAYARYTPAKWFSIIGGKFVNPIWQPSDMLISNDINPEGAAVRLQGQVAESFGLFFNGGFFVLDEKGGSTPNPLMYALQPGFKWNFSKDVFFRFAPTYYGFSNLKGNRPLDWVSGSNGATTNTLTNGNYAFEYNVINIGGEFGFNKPFGTSAIPYLGIFGSYLHNPDPSRLKTGYLAGMALGHTNVSKACDWAFEYTFRRIEKDAWLDIFPDSSFYNGATNVMGHRAKLLVGLAKNTALGLNYYNTWKLSGTPSTENLVQADLIFKF